MTTVIRNGITMMKTSPTTISFIRHGMVHNPLDIFYGRLPRFRLSKTGILDAQRAALAMKGTPLTAIYSSPLLRTRQTANSILEYHPTLRLHRSRLITEVKSPFEGRGQSSIDRVGGDVYAGGGNEHEQPENILQRSLKFLKRMRKIHKGEHIAATTHGDVVFFLQLWAKGCEVTAENKLRLIGTKTIPEYPTTGSITTLTYLTDGVDEVPACRYVNCSALS